ncbi:MAG: hypothetical protein IMF10_03345 [Proteobacteria bacterium]|nr:hypothetical protein [Pseudomonadota bacterium]
MKKYLIKANRLTGWLFLFVIPVLLFTGYGITGRYEFISRMATAEDYLFIHNLFIYVLIAVFPVHAAINIYFAIRRWGKR